MLPGIDKQTEARIFQHAKQDRVVICHGGKMHTGIRIGYGSKSLNVVFYETFLINIKR